jgi:hypothetical protein
MPQTQPQTVPAERQRRLTLSEIVEHLLSRGGGERSSVSISRNAKGGHQFEVTGRTADEDGMRTLAEVAATVVGLYDTLRRRYPTPDDDAPLAVAPESEQAQDIRRRAERWLAETPAAEDTPTQLARDVLALLHAQRIDAAAGEVEG